MAVFVPKGPGEILRDVEKDRILFDLIDKQLTNLVLKTCGTSTWLRHRQLVNASSKFLYYAFTTLAGFQTLGEEYTNIVQVDSSLRRTPSFVQRLCLAILDAIGYVSLEYILNQVDKKVRNYDVLHDEFKQRVGTIITVLKAALPFLIHFHHAIFYWNGMYYDIVKRLVGIRYVLARPWLSENRKLYGFKILAAITSLHVSVSLLHSVYSWYKTNKVEFQEISEIGTVREKCSLCLEPRTNTSTTTCGHLFCWNCIFNWLQTNNQCPICRDVIEPSRIVPLLNYH